MSDATHNAEVVITGLGLVTSLGASPDETFDAMLEGRVGIGAMPALEQPPSPDNGGGQGVELPAEFEPELPREARYLRHAIVQALSASNPIGRGARLGIVMGTTLHGMRAAGRALRSDDLGALRAFPGGAVLSGATRGLGIEGECLTVCSACSSGLAAVSLGVLLLREGVLDAVVVGGYDAVSEYAYAGFDSLRLVASGDMRPFAADRDGMKVAEGYAALVLEREADATARGVRNRGRIAGIGETADCFHLTQPQPQGEGAARAIRAALASARVGAGEVGMVSAHATGTPANDAAEYAALAAVFGEWLAATPVAAFKSRLGHTLGGAGAVELVLAVLARERGVVPGAAGTRHADERFAGLSLVTGRGREHEIGHTLNLSLGFGGANSAVVVSSGRARGRREARREEAVVTGVGVVVPGAVGNAACLERWRGPGRDPDATTISEATYSHLINARRVRRMSEYAKLTLAASEEACRHAGIADVAAFAGEACCVLGTLHGATGFCEAYYAQIVREGMGAANPALFAEGVPNAAAAQLSLALGIKGCCQTLIGSAAAGMDALRVAAMRVRGGEWTRVFVGAAEERSEMVDRAYAACRGGVRSASGAVTLIVESRGAAAARGAKLLGVVVEAEGGAGLVGEGAGEPAYFSVAPLLAVARLVLEGRAGSVSVRDGEGRLRGIHLAG